MLNNYNTAGDTTVRWMSYAKQCHKTLSNCWYMFEDILLLKAERQYNLWDSWQKCIYLFNYEVFKYGML